MSKTKPAARVAYSDSCIEMFNGDGTLRSFAELEREILQRALNAKVGSLSAVATQLEIGRSTLYRKINEYGLEYSLEG